MAAVDLGHAATSSQLNFAAGINWVAEKTGLVACQNKDAGTAPEELAVLARFSVCLSHIFLKVSCIRIVVITRINEVSPLLYRRPTALEALLVACSMRDLPCATSLKMAYQRTAQLATA